MKRFWGIKQSIVAAVGVLLLSAASMALATTAANANGLTAQVSDGLDEVTTGATPNYTILVTTGAIELDGVKIQLTMPSYLQVIDPGDATLSDQLLSWDVKKIDPEAEWTRVIKTKVGDIPADAVRSTVVVSVLDAAGRIIVAGPDADRITGVVDPVAPSSLAGDAALADGSSGTGASWAGMPPWLAVAVGLLIAAIIIFILILVLRRRNNEPILRRTGSISESAVHQSPENTGTAEIQSVQGQ